MISTKMIKKFFVIYLSIFIFITHSSAANNQDFNSWVTDFKKKAIASGVSKSVVNDFMSDVKFLPKVIEYDRYQPEFYEDTKTYINKRTNKRKIKKGLALYKSEKITIDKIENRLFKTFW